MTLKRLLLILWTGYFGFAGIVSQVHSQTFKWAKAIIGEVPTRSNVAASAIAIDASQNVYTTGSLSGTTDFDPGSGSFKLNGTAAFVSKLDSSGNFIWAKSMGGPETITGNDIAVDASGNNYTVGVYYGTADFDPAGSKNFNLKSIGGNDIFIVKLDSSGNLIWAKSIGGPEYDIVASIALDTHENIYITGNFKGTADFDPGPDSFKLTSAGGNDIFIAKLDSSGNFIWAKSIGGSNQFDYGYSVAVEASGKFIYTTGRFGDTVDFDPGPDSFKLIGGSAAAFVSKLDSSGNLVWAKRMEDGLGFKERVMAVDHGGNIFLTGDFNGSRDFNLGPDSFMLTSAGSQDIFITKLDPSGHFVWAKSIGSQNDDNGNGIALDRYSNIYITGNFKGTTDFDPGPDSFKLTSTGGTAGDIYISKLDSSGNFIWAVSTTGSPVGYRKNKAIAADVHGNTFTTGAFNYRVDFAFGQSIHPLISPQTAYSDMFVMKISPEENCRKYTNKYDTACADYVFNHTNYSKSGIYTDTFSRAGQCDSIATLDLTIIGTLVTSVQESACDSFNFNGQYMKQSGVYPDTLANFHGCDSVIILTLTINHSSSQNIAETDCGSFKFKDKTYTQSGIYTDTFKNITGCDSTIILNLTIKPVYLDTVPATACYSYKFNGKTYTRSGIYVDSFKRVSGCDSIITLKLTITNYLDTISTTTCNSYEFNGATYTQSGIYTDSFKRVSGCDSITTLNLIIADHYSDTIAETICNSYDFHGQTYTQSGTYSDKFKSIWGCDSIITLILTSPDATITQSGQSLSANAGASWQWIDCNKGNAAIPGATARVFTPSTPGNYAVIVTFNGTCIDTSDCYTVLSTSIETSKGTHPIKMYPNPCKDFVHIVSDLQGFSIALSSVEGKVVLQKTVKDGIMTLDISGLANGIFLLHIKDKDGQIIKTEKINKLK